MQRVFADQEGYVLGVHTPDQAVDESAYALEGRMVRSYLVPDEQAVAVVSINRETGEKTRGRLDLDFMNSYVGPVPGSVSRRQFFQGAAKKGLITQDEAKAAIRTGEVPESVQTFIAELPEGLRFDAEMQVSGAALFERQDAFLNAYATDRGIEPGQLDGFFREWAKL